jgi:hypothetical protein
MSNQELAKKLAIENKFIRAERYDLALREYDNSVEILGYVPDPNYDMEDFRGREMLFPKRWVTIGVLSFNYRVSV